MVTDISTSLRSLQATQANMSLQINDLKTDIIKAGNINQRMSPPNEEQVRPILPNVATDPVVKLPVIESLDKYHSVFHCYKMFDVGSNTAIALREVFESPLLMDVVKEKYGPSVLKRIQRFKCLIKAVNTKALEMNIEPLEAAKLR
jgi:hypothetical protein